MQKNLFFIIILFLFLIFQTQVFGQRSVVREKIATSAGNVEFVQTGNPDSMPSKWQIKLKNKVLYENLESYGSLSVVKTFKNFAGKEDVIVFMESEGGNACAVTHRILAIRTNGSFHLSEPIYNCVTPQLSRTANKITLYFPRSPVMRGTGFVPAETWVYQNGKLTQQKNVKRGR